MAKALRIAAIVVSVAAIAIPIVGQIVGPAALAAALGISAGTLATIGTVLTVSAAVLGVAAGIMAKKPTFGQTGAGSQLDFIADPLAGEPYVMGSARVGMDIVHEASWGEKLKYLGMVGALSCAGPIQAYDGFYADDTLISFSAGNATGYYADFMYLHTQLGARPEAAALDMSLGGGMPSWTASSKLSSIAAAGLILVADIDDGKIYSGGVPKMTHQIKGVFGYDPRLDSTNGGTGTQRPGGVDQDETDYAYSENPWVHHGTFALGRWVEGVKVIGPGLPATSIDWASHRDAANVADANGWTVSGRIMSTDRKWDVLKTIAQAGGGYPIPTGTKLACLVNAPRVSLATIEEEHLKGPVSAPTAALRRSRLNGGIPRYREPDQAWEIVPGATVRNSDYLTADGGSPRTKEIDLPLVADKDQAAQIIAYEVANSRELSPISVELDLYWAQYKMGDCLTLNLPSALLFNRKAVVIARQLDAGKNTVTFEFRTEDDAKHDWALSLTGTSPSTIVGSSPGAGDNGNQSTAEIQTALRDSYPKFGGATINATESGGIATITVPNFTMEYSGGTAVAVTGTTINVATGPTYYPYIDVTEIGDDTPTFGATTVYADALNSAAHPFRIYLNQSVPTPASGSGGSTSGGGFGGGYGGGGAIP